MTDDLSLEQRVHALIYDADPEIPAAAVIALVLDAACDAIDAIPSGKLDQWIGRAWLSEAKAAIWALKGCDDDN